LVPPPAQYTVTSTGPCASPSPKCSVRSFWQPLPVPASTCRVKVLPPALTTTREPMAERLHVPLPTRRNFTYLRFAAPGGLPRLLIQTLPPETRSRKPSPLMSAKAAWYVCFVDTPECFVTSVNFQSPRFRYITLWSPGYTVVRKKSTRPSLSTSPATATV